MQYLDNQRRRSTHCRLLHGYKSAFTFTFGCDELDNKNWAVDFGGLKPLKKWLEDHFDHKLVVDKADPHMDTFLKLNDMDLADVVIFEGKRAEKFCSNTHLTLQINLLESRLIIDVMLLKNVQNTAPNSAIYEA